MTTTTIDAMTDNFEIGRLVDRLGRALDEGSFDDFVDLFVADATARTQGGIAEGVDAMIAQAQRNHRPTERVQHIITNVTTQLNGDVGTVRANLNVHFAVFDASTGVAIPEVRYTLGSIYRFGVTRTTDGWRLTSVETIPVWRSGTPLPR